MKEEVLRDLELVGCHQVEIDRLMEESGINRLIRERDEAARRVADSSLRGARAELARRLKITPSAIGRRYGAKESI